MHVAGELREQLALMRTGLAADAENFRKAHGDLMEDYRRQICCGIRETLEGFRDDVGRLSGDNPLARRLAESTADYVGRCQSALRDLPVFAVALRPERESFRRAVASCGMVYLSMRLLGDSSTDLPEGAGMLLCLHGILQLTGFTGNGDGRSPLAPFLDRYYALARKLDDIENHPRDEQRGRPNLVSLLRTRSTDVWQEVEAIVGGEFLDLEIQADELPRLERGIVRLKLHESLETAFGLGLFQESRPPSAAAGLRAASLVEEILESRGPEALEAVACGACGAADGEELFRKQGFAVRRCPLCSHVYVSPRLAGSLAPLTGGENENDSGLTSFFDAERLNAAVVCDLVSEYCAGRRWLHYGLAGGHLPREAMARGAQVYAADESADALEALRPLLGRRLWQVGRPPGELPWGPHDAVLLQHTAELFRDPRSALERAARALRPRGLLYVAVPDADSLQFGMLGRHWEAVSPVLRWHYFVRESLERLLADCGFAVVEWLEPPPVPASLAAPWMQLFRRLGGSEAGELTVLARRARRSGDAER